MATSFISGLASGLDWRTMITQLMQVERQPVTNLENRKSDLSDRYSEWTKVNSLLSSLKTSAGALSSSDDFNLYTSNSSLTGSSSNVDDLLTYAVGTNATEGTYNITVNNVATAQKISTKSFRSTSEDLGMTGDLLVNGRVLSIASTDSLSDIRTKVNALNSGDNPAGVTASIITVSSGEYRLTLTSKSTGAEGISISNASGTNILSELGLADSTLTLRNAVTGGAQSGAFSDSAESFGTLLGLTSPASGSVSIAGTGISIDLANDSLEDIKDRINASAGLQAAGVSASIITVTTDGEAEYKLQIDGTQSFVDSGNILQTLGILKQGYSDVEGVTGTIQNTTSGTAISDNILLTDIDGYNTWTSGDSITIAGTDHGGIALTPAEFTITENSTVGDLLAAIETAFGDEVTAYVDGRGAVVVEDNQSGTSSLSLTLTSNVTAGNSSLDFGTFGSSTIRKREIVEGEDAQISLDGINFSRATNQISDVISGVTLNLLAEDDLATITLNVNRDYEGIKEKIQDFVDGYNGVMSYIAAQNTAPAEGEDANPLFADASLQTIKSTLRSIILSGVTGLDSTLNHLSIIGVNLDKSGQLSIDDDKLDGYLETNFEDVMNLFVAQGSSTSSNLTYLDSGLDMPEGDYEVEITRAATQGTTVGSGFTGTLAGDASLTLTGSGGTEQTISLNAGWNITSIVNAINSGNTLGVTAQNDGGQLRLTSGSYGSAGVTVSVTGGNLGITNGTYNGLDVQGRIREQGSLDWMTMTGSGQTLTGDGDQDVEDLKVKYTGTGIGIFDFTFSKGIGDKLEQALFSMSDSLTGYVTNKQESLQNQMKSIDTKIENMEIRLSKYEETLIAKFTTMERLLSQLQSQQSWLTGQINSLGSS